MEVNKEHIWESCFSAPLVKFGAEKTPHPQIFKKKRLQLQKQRSGPLHSSISKQIISAVSFQPENMPIQNGQKSSFQQYSSVDAPPSWNILVKLDHFPK